MPTIYHDFETGSPLDLTDVGAWIYSCCPETRVWCVAWAIDDGPVRITIPGKDPVPPEWFEAVGDPEWRFSAFNASFERAITVNILGPRFGWPVPLLEQYDCSQALALSYALPATLEGAAAILKLTNQKDATGSGVMMKWAKPRKARKDEDRQQLHWPDDPQEFEQLGTYCAQDMRTERELRQRLPSLPADEKALWLLSEQINERGFYTDGPLIDAAIRVGDWFTADINRRLAEVTEGGITAVAQIPHRLAWLREHGYASESTDKVTIARQLRRKNLPDIIRRVLELRQACAHAAAAKPEAFKRWRAADGRVHGAFRFHGAHTGRWTSLGVQAQNLKRPNPQLDIESAVAAVINDPVEILREKYPQTLDTIGSLARALICAQPGYKLIAADFSGIEARITAWISGDKAEIAQWEKFDRTGCKEDEPYFIAGIKTFRFPEDQARGSGKTGTLAFGFTGSVDAWRRIAPPGDTTSDEEVKKLRDAWRKAHQPTADFWGKLNRAAIQAVRKKGQIFDCKPVSFVYEDAFLFMRLPSGRRLAYPFARIEIDKKFGDSVVVHKVWGNKKWADYRRGRGSYGGTWIQNAVQAAARDLFVAAMQRLEAHDYKIVHHTHDEIIAEVPQDFGSEDEFQRLMIELPAWAAGLPMAAKVRAGDRLCKTGAPDATPENDPIEIDEAASDALAELIDENDDAEIPEAHICAQCHLDPPDGSERRSAYNDLWMHAHCEDEFIRARMTEEGLAESGASEQPTASPPPPPQDDEPPDVEDPSRESTSNGYAGNGRDDGYRSGETPRGTATKHYVYKDAQGRLVMRVTRTSAKVFPTQHWSNGRWMTGWPKTVVPYRLPELLAAPANQPVFVCEGEKDTDNVIALGLIATTNPGGSKVWQKELAQWFKGKELIYILEDNDEPGRTHTTLIITALRNIVPTVVTVSFPELPEHGDVSDWLDAGGNLKLLLARAEEARKRNTTGGYGLVDLHTVKSRATKWIWPGHLARGALELIAGLPEIGKSQTQVQYVACATTGREWPDKAPGILPCRVLMITAEDTIATTLVPRLRAAGADLTRIQVLDWIKRNGREETFLLGSDLEALEQILQGRPDIGLVTIDPITAYMGHDKGFDSHRATDVRSQLTPLKKLAERTGVCFSAVTHPPKNASHRAMDQFIGSQAFIAAARIGHLCVAEMEDDATGGKKETGRRLFTNAKINIGKRQPTQIYRIAEKDTGDTDPETGVAIRAPVIEWEGESPRSAEEALAATRLTKTSRGASVQEFLSDFLAGGPQPRTMVIERGIERGFTADQLRRAKEKVGIASFKKEFTGIWYWSLPEHAPDKTDDPGDEEE